jgi:hypothetical protein
MKQKLCLDDMAIADNNEAAEKAFEDFCNAMLECIKPTDHKAFNEIYDCVASFADLLAKNPVTHSRFIDTYIDAIQRLLEDCGLLSEEDVRYNISHLPAYKRALKCGFVCRPLNIIISFILTVELSNACPMRENDETYDTLERWKQAFEDDHETCLSAYETLLRPIFACFFGIGLTDFESHLFDLRLCCVSTFTTDTKEDKKHTAKKQKRFIRNLNGLGKRHEQG